MGDMVEPDRTIAIVSIIGLVIIWGSFFYHKYVQGSDRAQSEPQTPVNEPVATAEVNLAEKGEVGGQKAPTGRRKKGRKRRG